ncbi:MAG: SDR family NAD(P)-dependent oxidoreductase, partial [Mesorhizobium sp.]
MELRLEGKVVLVTGATQGIGRAIAETLAHSGAGGLLVTGREPVRGNDVATSLSQAGTPATFIAADLADTTAPARLVDECIGRFGRIDALVNAAGLTNRASFLDADLDDWAALFAVNARAPFFLMQAAITQMRKQGHGGAIVNILSINAHCGSPELAVYSATKGALAT